VRRAKVVEIGRLLGLHLEPLEADVRERLLVSAAEHRAAGRGWREAIDLARLASLETDPQKHDALLVLAQSAAAAVGVRPDLGEALEHGLKLRHEGTAAAWVIGDKSLWIEPPGRERVDLGRHGSLRRVLEELVARRLDGRPPCSADDLLAAGWPGERVLHDSGMLRVYTAIRRLRKLGLDEMLVTRDEGYFLDPKVAIRRG
jgi:hypothetical protein